MERDEVITMAVPRKYLRVEMEEMGQVTGRFWSREIT